MNHLDFLLLGAPEIRLDGRTLRFRSRKVAALLVYLAVIGGKHNRRTLAQFFWPESDAERAMAALRNTLRHLREALAAANADHIQHLVADGDVLHFHSSAGTALDIHVLDSAYRLAQTVELGSAPHNEGRVRAREQLQVAVNIYRGDFLDAFELADAPPFNEWRDRMRAVWHERLELVLDRLSELQLEAGDAVAAQATAERWIAHDTLNETARRRLMEACLAAGDRARALRTYDAYRTVLRAELDAEPEPLLVALAESIRHGDALTAQGMSAHTSPRTTPAPPVHPSPEPSIIPMAGREVEFARLIEAFETSRRGTATIVLVEGAAGIGKTRLLEEFARWAARDAEVLETSAWQSTGGLFFQPVVDALRPRIERERAPDNLLADVWLMELSRLLPELHDRYPDLPPPTGDEASARGRLFEAVARLLQALSERAPVVFLVDDAHWADSGSRDLLQYAMRRCRSEGSAVVLLLAVALDADGQLLGGTGLREWLGGVQRDLRPQTITLGPLTAVDVLNLVVALAPQQTASDQLVQPPVPRQVEQFSRWLFGATGGHSGQIADLLGTLRQRQLLRWNAREGTWSLDLDVALTTLPHVSPTRPPEPSQPDAPPAISGDTLLRTKLFVPPPRSGLLDRPRLIERLNRAVEGKLTVVTAPAGFGKTTILGAWLAERFGAHSTQVAWVSLDEADNDPTRFWTHVAAALDTLLPGVGTPMITMLQSSQSPPMEALLANLLNGLASLPAICVLVLDDYHLVTAPAIHDALRFVVDHLPPRLRLMIASRAELPLPLARLRSRGELTEVRTTDLRFTTAEAAAFLQQIMDLPLSAQDVAALEARTEGWIAGLQLAALAMRERNDIVSFIRAFAAGAGSHRFVVDYLAEEVFVREPLHIQHFLLQTSILDRMCGPLCDAVMLGVGTERGRAKDAYSQMLLQELERSNVFTIALDDEQRWYRYHHLFGEMMRVRLQRSTGTAEVATLHRRAAAWYAEEGLVHEAVRHALAAEAFEDAACLIEQQGLMLVFQGQHETVIGWIQALPERIIRVRFSTLLVHALGLLLTNQLIAAEARVKDMEATITPDVPYDEQQIRRGLSDVVLGNIRYFLGDMAQAIVLMEEGVSLLPEKSSDPAITILMAIARTAGNVFAATAYKITGEVGPDAERRAADAIGPVAATGNLVATLNSYIYLARLQVAQGRLRTAATTFANVTAGTGSDSLQRLVRSPAYFCGMGDILREWNDLERAEEHLRQGVRLVHGTAATDADIASVGFIALARLYRARGRSANALATLEEFEALARQRGYAQPLLDYAAAARARLLLSMGDLDRARQWAVGSGLDLEQTPDYPREWQWLTLVRIRIAEEQPQDVLPLLDRALEDAERGRRVSSVIEMEMLRALALQAGAALPRAFVALTRAFALAAPEGYVRIFVDEGRAMAQLLGHWLEAVPDTVPHELRDYARLLLDICSREASETHL